MKRPGGVYIAGRYLENPLVLLTRLVRPVLLYHAIGKHFPNRQVLGFAAENSLENDIRAFAVSGAVQFEGTPQTFGTVGCLPQQRRANGN